jgi:uncharacterized lipoprotein YajG
MLFRYQNKMEKNKITPMKKVIFLGFVCLVGCSYVPEKVSVSYEPLTKSTHATLAIEADVDVTVVDNRRDGKKVGHKRGDRGYELASITLKGELAEEIAFALKGELQALGCTIQPGGVAVEIEIQKFYNEFKQGFLGHCGVSELILGVHVKKFDGSIAYSKTITGVGENADVWLHSGKNAKVALDEAFNDAIHKLMNDQAFLQTLKSCSV